MGEVIQDRVDQVLRLLCGKQEETEQHFVGGLFAPGDALRRRRGIRWVLCRIIKDSIDHNLGTLPLNEWVVRSSTRLASYSSTLEHRSALVLLALVEPQSLAWTFQADACEARYRP